MATTPETGPAGARSPESLEAADAGLLYVSDEEPGIRRLRCGRGFRYCDPEGKTLRDEDTLARIRALAIPPAYREVWICRSPRGHLQATGRDARGRKQYATTRAQQRDTASSTAAGSPRHCAPAPRAAQGPGPPGFPREKAGARVATRAATRCGWATMRRARTLYACPRLRRPPARVPVRIALQFPQGREAHSRSDDRRLRGCCADAPLPGSGCSRPGEDGERPGGLEHGHASRERRGADFTAKDFRLGRHPRGLPPLAPRRTGNATGGAGRNPAGGSGTGLRRWQRWRYAASPSGSCCSRAGRRQLARAALRARGAPREERRAATARPHAEVRAGHAAPRSGAKNSATRQHGPAMAVKKDLPEDHPSGQESPANAASAGEGDGT